MKMDEITQLVEEKCKIGMVLTLKDNVNTCIDAKEDSYGMRYYFENGIGWTKSNIISNIRYADLKGWTWSIK